MIRSSLAALLACTALSTYAHALQVPTPTTPGEPRVLQVPYSPNDVIQIIAPAVGETQIVLSPDETKFDVSIVSKAWHHDAAGHSFAVAPDPGAPTTVAHVVTYLGDGKTRRYTFELTAAAEGVKPTPTFGDQRVASNDPSAGVGSPAPVAPYLTVAVTYAQAETTAKVEAAGARRSAAIAAWRAQRAMRAEGAGEARARAMLASDAAAQRRRCNFMWRGNPAVLPTAACDTGAATTFLWPGQMPPAAVFLINPDGTEQSVTQAPSPDRPGLVIVPATSQFWRIRRGNLVADIFDVSFNPIGMDTGTGTVSPRVRTRLRADAGARQ